MVTLNQVITNLSNIASAHYQLKSFGNGSIQEFATSGTTNYPAMWVDYEPSQVQGRSYLHVLRIYVCDRLIKGKKNELDVFSDTQQICLDILAQVQSNIYGWKLVSDSIALSPFSEPRFDDEDAGYYFDLTLKVPFDYDRCQIPFTTAITNPSQYPSNTGSAAGTINVYIDGVLQSSTSSTDLDNETVNILWT